MKENGDIETKRNVHEKKKKALLSTAPVKFWLYCWLHDYNPTGLCKTSG